MRAVAWTLVVMYTLACSTRGPSQLTWETDEAAAFDKARKARKAVLIDLTAKWAMPSVELSRLLDADELATMIDANFVPLRVDVSEDSDRIESLRRRYGSTILPSVIAVDRNGAMLGRLTKLVGMPELRAFVLAAADRRAQ